MVCETSGDRERPEARLSQIVIAFKVKHERHVVDMKGEYCVVWTIFLVNEEKKTSRKAREAKLT